MSKVRKPNNNMVRLERARFGAELCRETQRIDHIANVCGDAP